MAFASGVAKLINLKNFKIEMSSEAIVSNKQRSLPTWFYVRLCLMYKNKNV
jgi:hypothetical protein